MKFTLSIDMDNAAFTDDAVGDGELVRILDKLRQEVVVYTSPMFSQFGESASGKVRDINGNTVGEWSIAKEVQP